MQNKSLMMAAIGMMVALMGGVIAKQMGMSRILAECSTLSRHLGREQELGDLRITPLSDPERGKGLYISFSPPNQPSDWDAGKDEWIREFMERLALKAVLIKGLPADYLLLESSGQKLHIKSTRISTCFPNLPPPASDS